MKMYLISDNIDTWTGMRLAGIEGIVVHKENEILGALNKALENQSVGIILITEKLGSLIPDKINNIRLNYKTPLIVEIPDRHGTGRTPDSIMKYVREAIGLKI